MLFWQRLFRDDKTAQTAQGLMRQAHAIPQAIPFIYPLFMAFAVRYSEASLYRKDKSASRACLGIAQTAQGNGARVARASNMAIACAPVARPYGQTQILHRARLLVARWLEPGGRGPVGRGVCIRWVHKQFLHLQRLPPLQTIFAPTTITSAAHNFYIFFL